MTQHESASVAAECRWEGRETEHFKTHVWRDEHGIFYVEDRNQESIRVGDITLEGTEVALYTREGTCYINTQDFWYAAIGIDAIGQNGVWHQLQAGHVAALLFEACQVIKSHVPPVIANEFLERAPGFLFDPDGKGEEELARSIDEETHPMYQSPLIQWITSHREEIRHAMNHRYNEEYEQSRKKNEEQQPESQLSPQLMKMWEEEGVNIVAELAKRKHRIYEQMYNNYPANIAELAQLTGKSEAEVEHNIDYIVATRPGRNKYILLDDLLTFHRLNWHKPEEEREGREKGKS